VFRELVTGWAAGWGNGYAEIERNAAGEPVALWPIHPSRAFLHRVDGETVLDVHTGDCWTGAPEGVRLKQSDFIHLRGFGDNPLEGISVIRLAAEALGISLAAQSYGAAFFGNGATPGLLLIHPGNMTEPQQTSLRESWRKRHGGVGNSGSVAVLQGGIKVERMTIPPEEAQFLQTRQFQIAEIARWFRMPPHVVQDLTASTNNNIEHQGIEYVTMTISPWLNRWEQELERKLFNPRDQENFDIKHNDRGLMRGDSKSRAEYHRTMISTGMETPNEARLAEDMNPSD